MFGIGTDAPSAKLHAILDSAATNTPTDVLRLGHTSTGNTAVGFGALIRFDAERTGSTTDGMGRLGFVADTMTSSRVDGAFIVQTGLDGSYTERLRIHSNGKMETNGSSGYGYVMHRVNGTLMGYVGDGGSLSVSPTNATTDFVMRAVGKLAFLTNNSTTAKMTILADGKVGIGTNAPGATLHVRGSDGYLKFDTSGADGTIKSDYNLKLYADDNNNNSSGYQNIQFYTAGANERMRIDSAGKVGIGTNAPATKLEIASGDIRLTDAHVIEWGGTKARIGGSNSGDYLRFYTDDTVRMEIESNGNVGIGTNAPEAALTVAGPNYTHAIFRTNQSTASQRAGGGFSSLGHATATSRFARLFLDADGANFSGTDYFTIEKFGNSGEVKFLQYSNATMSFWVNTTTQAMTIKNDGKVGIGTNAPSGKLEVRVASETGASSTHGIRIGTASNAVNIGASDSGYAWLQTRDADPLSLQPIGGKVGIGTIAPSVHLDVYTAVGWGVVDIDGASGGELRFQKAGTTWLDIYGNDSSYAVLKATSHLSIYVNGSTLAAYFKSDGKVGIGTNSPAEILTLDSSSNTRLLMREGGSNKGQISAGGGGLYIQNLAGDVIFRNISDADTVRIKNDGKVGIGTASPAAPLDVPRASDYKVIKLGDDITSHYVMSGNSDHTLTLTCASYFQAEIVITAHQTNGGTYNNLYMRGIWSNNHTSHHWDEIENVGDISGSTFTITVGQNGATTNSGEWKIVHDYTSGTFVKFTVRVTDFYGTHAYTIS